MTKKEFISQVNNANIVEKNVIKIETVYKVKLPVIIKKLVSVSEKTEFIEDWRLMANSEIVSANEELHVDFVGKGMLPLIDCGDNNFIVYHFNTDEWSKFNIIDECIFKKKTRIEEFL